MIPMEVTKAWYEYNKTNEEEKHPNQISEHDWLIQLLAGAVMPFVKRQFIILDGINI